MGPAVGLFEKPFFEDCFRVLREDGIMVAQSGSPYFQLDIVAKSHKNMSEVFPIARTYIAGTPSYGGLWSFVIGSKRYLPEEPIREDSSVLEKLKYYNLDVHLGAFKLPTYIKKAIDEAKAS